MNRTEIINNIIKQRQPLAQRIEQVENTLKEHKKALENLEELRVTIIPQIIDNSLILEVLKNLDLKTLSILIETELKSLRKLKLRFKRPTLNLGVVGRARQGKSRYLQSVSGLTKAEIPDGDREHCTGVRSTIYHRVNDPQKNYDFDGLVWFHTPQSFLQEVIKPYYEQLQLGNYPQNMPDFANNLLPELPDNFKLYAEYKAKYEHLKKYKDYLGEYYKLLGTTTLDKPLKITKQQIREYVAQDDENGNRIYFNYLAVKEVKIYCPFPLDVGKIALIDLPGLGDTGIGDEARLIKTVGEDVDAVIFVRMPKHSGDYWADVDVKLYDIAKSALTDLPLDLWSFMVLNKTPQLVNNYPNCEDLQRTIKEKHINVVQSWIVDCASKNEVGLFLDAVLNYLTENITKLDRKYAQTCQIRLQKLEGKINHELDKVHNLLANYANQSAKFLSLFNQFIHKLTKSMTELSIELRNSINEIDPYFEDQVKNALNNCKLYTDIPSEELIKQRAIHPDNKGSFKVAYYQYIGELRANISQNFLSLNDGLKNSLINLKNEIVNILIHEVNLGDLTVERGVNFLKFMADQLEAKNSTKLELGFRTFYEFEMSYGSLLLQSIRQHLNELLSPDTNVIELEQLTPATVRDNLKLLYDQAITKCEETLNEWLTKPSQVQYYMFEEFVDRILYAEGMNDEWRVFLQDPEICPLVWTEIRQIEDKKRLQNDWKRHLEKAKINPNSLTFL